MSSQPFQNAIELIDRANNEDPNPKSFDGGDYQKEVRYSEGMSACLEKLSQNASEVLKIAVRAAYPPVDGARSQYPKTRMGYLEWRTVLFSFHAEKPAKSWRSADATRNLSGHSISH